MEHSRQVVVKISNRSFINSNRAFPRLVGHNYEVIQTTETNQDLIHDFLTSLTLRARRAHEGSYQRHNVASQLMRIYKVEYFFMCLISSVV